MEPQPGLVLRLLTRAEMEALVPIVLETGLHGHALAEVRDTVLGWWDSPLCWPLGLFWQGRAKQYECYHVVHARDGDLDRETPTLARAGFMTHLDLWRPRWFYREAGRVPFERLRAAGIRRMVSFPRADRPDWIRYLLDTFGARELGPSHAGRTIAIEYDLDRAIAACPGWPDRRTAGDAWRWRHAGAGVELREMGDDELAAVEGQLAALWGGPAHPAVPEAREALHHRYQLDRATILLAERAGVLVNAFAVHMREPDRCHAGVLGRYGDPRAELLWRVLYRGVLEWAYAVGYRTLTGYVPKATYEHPVFQRALQHTRATPVRRCGRQAQTVEVSHDLAACCMEPLSEWEVWRERPALPAHAELRAHR